VNIEENKFEVKYFVERICSAAQLGSKWHNSTKYCIMLLGVPKSESDLTNFFRMVYNCKT